MRKEGCDKCGGSGYKGRVALHELLVGSPTIKAAIKKSSGVDNLRELAVKEGMRTLKMDGIRKIFLGLVDFEQVNKVCL
jgi:type II secretory ATPase GspE/PulE/Tfp pilus assembly ATPase PilB-like protein